MAGTPEKTIGRPIKRGKWTIHDIAEAAGVSAKTVSRVVNDEAGVGQATRLRIRQLIEEVGYQPHLGARSMRSAPLDSIGVTLGAPMHVVPISQGIFLWIFSELYRVFGSKGNFVLFDLNPYASPGATDYARGLWQQRYGACVVVGPLASNDSIIEHIHQSGNPYVALGRLDKLPECSSATVDYEEGTYLSTRYLIEKGHRRVAMLKAFEGFQPGIERERGYRRALDEAGLEYHPEDIKNVDFASRTTVQTLYRLLLNHEITGLVDCSAREDAESIRDAGRLAGRTPGEDFELVTWTYTANATVMKEASAHVWLPVLEAAAEGFEFLARWIGGESDGPCQVLYRPTLYPTVEKGELPKPSPMFESHL